MNIFLTFAVYSLRISNDMPIQSDYVPDISAYFLSSIGINMVAFAWVVYLNRCSTKGEIPRCLEIIAVFLKKSLFCCCFPVEKRKVDDENKIQFYKPHNNSQFIMKNKKCRFCDRCETCETDHKKDKDKAKTKKEVDSKLEALNYLVFVLLFIAMLVVQLIIWIGINTS